MITKPVRSREHSRVNYIIESRDNIKLMKIKEMVNKTGREMSISFPGTIRSLFGLYY